MVGEWPVKKSRGGPYSKDQCEITDGQPCVGFGERMLAIRRQPLAKVRPAARSVAHVECIFVSQKCVVRSRVRTRTRDVVSEAGLFGLGKRANGSILLVAGSGTCGSMRALPKPTDAGCVEQRKVRVGSCTRRTNDTRTAGWKGTSTESNGGHTVHSLPSFSAAVDLLHSRACHSDIKTEQSALTVWTTNRLRRKRVHGCSTTTYSARKSWYPVGCGWICRRSSLI